MWLILGLRAVVYMSAHACSSDFILLFMLEPSATIIEIRRRYLTCAHSLARNEIDRGKCIFLIMTIDSTICGFI